MIDKIFVSGFRSLSNLNLHIQPGLNILVGPNGSGKTNLIAFFQFLSHLANSTLAHAISAAGGAGAIFQKIGVDTYHPEFQATINGRVESPQGYSRQRICKYLYYRYEFKLGLSKERNIIYVKYESLSAYLTNKALKRSQIPDSNFDWDISIERLKEENGDQKINLKNFSENRLKNMLKKTEYSHRDLTKQNVHSWVSRYLSPNYEFDLMILTLPPFAVPLINEIRQDFVGGNVLSIQPHIVRQPEDMAKPPEIQQDGSGLAPTLYALRELEERHLHRRTSTSARRNPYAIRRRELRRGLNLHRRVVSYVRLANESIKDINVVSDPFVNQLRVVTTLEGVDADVPLPITALSDGTVKWITLVTAIMTSGAVFAIEEPENFLHPLMQQKILELVRHDSTARSTRSFTIMSTHSESLLNAADPREIIVFKMIKGVTEARRIGNKAALANAIRDTGFGLGYFYLTGALERA